MLDHAPRTPDARSIRRRGQQRWMAGCAIAIALTAAVRSGEARAQAFEGAPATVSGLVDYSRFVTPTPGSETITINSDTAVINWTPTDTATNAGVPIEFSLTGSVATFERLGQSFTVLNRILPADASRPIRFNGTVNSTITSPPGGPPPVTGGNVWFYSPGGVIASQFATFNVGSLVLTAADIDTTGGLFGPDGSIRFRGADGSQARVDIRPGAQINAPGEGSYVALVAPSVHNFGTINVNGSAAHVAAEQVDIRINQGLFDIDIIAGTTASDALIHLGTTAAPTPLSFTDNQRVFLAAVPKNDAITMLVGGQLGSAATGVTTDNGSIVLSGGYDIAGGSIAAPEASGTAPVNLRIAQSTFLSSVTGATTGTAEVSPPRGLSTVFQGNVDLRAAGGIRFGAGLDETVSVAGFTSLISPGGSVEIFADNSVTEFGYGTLPGETLFSRDLFVDASATGSSTSAPGGIGGNATGGVATLRVSDTASLTVLGQANVLADGIGGFGAQTGGDGSGGTARVQVEDSGTASFGNLTLSASGFGNGGGSPNPASVNGGDGTGGTAEILLEGGTLSATSVTVTAGGTGGGGLGLPIANAGDGSGGTVRFVKSGGTQTIETLQLNAIGSGGHGDTGGSGGDGIGGDMLIQVTDGTLDPEYLYFDVSGLAGTARPGGADGNATGDGHSAQIIVDGETAVLEAGSQFFGRANSEAYGSGNAPSTVTGGNIVISARNGGTIRSTGSVQFSADGRASFGQFGSPDVGPDAEGGNVTIGVDGGTIDFTYLYASAGAYSNFAMVTAGDALGGNVTLYARDNAVTSGNFVVSGGLSANTSASGGSAGDAGTGTGGTISIYAENATLDLAGTDVNLIEASGFAGGGFDGGVGEGIGGTIEVEAREGGVLNLGLFYTSTSGTAVLTQETGIFSYGDGGRASGGQTTFTVSGGTLTADEIYAEAAGVGGAAAVGPDGEVYVGGEGRGGNVSFTMSSGSASVSSLSFVADGIGGLALDAEADETVGLGGAGFGGSAALTLNGGLLTSDTVTLSANGTGGDGGASPAGDAGAGGSGTGGSASFATAGDFFSLGSLALFATGEGGVGGYSGILDEFGYGAFDPGPGRGGAGGIGTGGGATLDIDFDPVINALVIDTSGYGADGGDGAIGGDGGDGLGGAGIGGARLDLAFGELTVNGGSISSNGTGGNGGHGYDGAGGRGGGGFGGDARVTVTGASSALTLMAGEGSSEFGLFASGFGGSGGLGDAGASGSGGDAEGGLAQFDILDGANVLAGPRVSIRAEAVGGDGSAGSSAGNGTAGGSGGNALGGTALLNIEGGTLSSLLAEVFPLDWTVSAIAQGGSAGTGGSTSAPGSNGTAGGNGGNATGGTAAIVASDAQFEFGDLLLDARGYGGSGAYGGAGGAGFGPDGVGGDGTGGTASFASGGGTAPATPRTVESILLQASGFGGAISDEPPSGTGFAGDTILRDDSTAPSGGLTIGYLAAYSEGSAGAPGTGFTLATAANSLEILDSADIVTGTEANFAIGGAGTLTVGGAISVLAETGIAIDHANQPTGTASITASTGYFQTNGLFRSAPGSIVRTTGELTVDAGSIDAGRFDSESALFLARTGDLSVVETLTASDVLLRADAGAVTVSNNVAAGGEIRALGTDVTLNATGALDLTQAEASDGDLSVTVGGLLTARDATATGNVFLRSTDGDIAANAVRAGGALSIDAAQGNAGFAGLATGSSISVFSRDISFGSAGQLGEIGTTTGLQLTNADNTRGTYVGGEDVSAGYSLSAQEMLRLFSDSIGIFGSAVEDADAGSLSVGSPRQPDVIVRAFTLASRAGTSNGNLGAQGSLNIATPGKMRVEGAAVLTGLGDGNRFDLQATEALEVIAGSGSIDMRAAGGGLSGVLSLSSADIIVASQAAIADVAAATTTAAIDARLAINDGAVSDDGHLRAGGIEADVIGGFYVQNSGAGSEFADRRGMTVGTGGFRIASEGDFYRIVVNGQQVTPSGGFATGLDLIPLLTINGQQNATTGFDPGSTANGCLIASAASCGGVIEPELPRLELPRDVFENAIDPENTEEAVGNLFPTTLIELDEFEPLGFEPLVDEPVTGAGNDDLWTPACDPDGGDCEGPPPQE